LHKYKLVVAIHFLLGKESDTEKICSLSKRDESKKRKSVYLYSILNVCGSAKSYISLKTDLLHLLSFKKRETKMPF
jgi:hypothetical protein